MVACAAGRCCHWGDRSHRSDELALLRISRSTDPSLICSQIRLTRRSDGLPAVEAACAEAITQGVHSADVVLNILARRRDPGPVATILTPDALRLAHLPIADCARYDSLRRAS